MQHLQKIALGILQELLHLQVTLQLLELLNLLGGDGGGGGGE